MSAETLTGQADGYVDLAEMTIAEKYGRVFSAALDRIPAPAESDDSEIVPESCDPDDEDDR